MLDERGTFFFGNTRKHPLRTPRFYDGDLVNENTSKVKTIRKLDRILQSSTYYVLCVPPVAPDTCVTEHPVGAPHVIHNGSVAGNERGKKKKSGKYKIMNFF